jgi:hypothetical protein
LQNIIDSGHKNCIRKDDLVKLNIIDHISIKKVEFFFKLLPNGHQVVNIENENSKSKKSKDVDEKSFQEFKEISNFKILDQSSKIHCLKKGANTICISLCHLN